jgi:hypothetical protein
MRRVDTVLRWPRTTLGLFGVLAVLGVGAELTAGTSDWLADLLVGLSVGCAGAVVVGRHGRDPVGWLLVGVSALWFVGTLASAPEALGSIGRELELAHRAPLLVMLVAPIWAARSTPKRWRWTWFASVIVVAGACAVSVGPWRSAHEALVVVATTTGVVAIAEIVGGVSAARRGAWAGAIPATGLWVAAATASLGLGAVDADRRLLAYQIGVVAAGSSMAVSRIGRRTVDAIVSVGRGEVRGAMGDPSLRIGFEDPDGTFRALDGSPVIAVGAEETTEVDLGESGRARVVHTSGLLEDGRTRRDVEVAARLLAEHHRLTSDVQRHAASVSASRARLVVAADRASAVLSAELARRVLPHLDFVLGAVPSAPGGAIDPRVLATEVRDEVAHLATGAMPAQLRGGLVAALRAMARDAPVCVELSLEAVDVGEEQARAFYFVAGEALTNAVRHGSATRVTIGLSEHDDALQLEVADDGDGAIALRPGGGLIGLSDRLASLGGSLRCGASTVGGSAVTARLPRTSPAAQPIGSHSGIVNRSL